MPFAGIVHQIASHTQVCVHTEILLPRENTKESRHLATLSSCLNFWWRLNGENSLPLGQWFFRSQQLRPNFLILCQIPFEDGL